MAGRSSRPPERDPQQLAREVCLRLLDLRPHTRAELATALARRGVAAEAAQAVLDRFGEAGLVDDAAFAEAWVSSRQAGKGLARRALAHELRGRGVAGDVVDEAVGALDAETELVTARWLVSRRLAVMADLPADTRARRLAGMLARRGYSPELVAHVIREVLEGGPGGPGPCWTGRWRHPGTTAFLDPAEGPDLPSPAGERTSAATRCRYVQHYRGPTIDRAHRLTFVGWHRNDSSRTVRPAARAQRRVWVLHGRGSSTSGAAVRAAGPPPP